MEGIYTVVMQKISIEALARQQLTAAVELLL